MPMRSSATRCAAMLTFAAVLAAGSARDARALDAEARLAELHRAANPARAPSLVMETRAQGRRYLTNVDVKIEGRASNKDWMFTQAGHVVFGATMVYDSAILENNGREIVEQRRYQAIDQTVIVSVDKLRVDFVNPRIARDVVIRLVEAQTIPGAGIPLRRALDWVLDEAGVELGDEDITLRKPVVLRRDPGKFFSAIRASGLRGKTLRIVYRNDGTGIHTVTGVGCTVDEEDERFVRQGTYLFDAAFLGGGQKKIGERWTIPASVFGQLAGDALEGEPQGALGLTRRPDTPREAVDGQTRDHTVLAVDPTATTDIRVTQVHRKDGKDIAEESGILRITDGTAYFVRIPEDRAKRQPKEMYLSQFNAAGTVELKTLSRDHLLFQARFEAAPTVTIRYLSYPAPAKP